MITCEPLHAVPGRFSQCLSDQALGLVRLIGTDRRVHGLTTDLTLVPVGRVADAMLPESLGQIQIDAGFDPAGTRLVAPVHSGIGLSDMNGNLLWQRDDFGGAIFTPDGRLWAERMSASARPQIHLLDPYDGTTTAWLDLHDPEATDTGWLQATPTNSSRAPTADSWSGLPFPNVVFRLPGTLPVPTSSPPTTPTITPGVCGPPPTRSSPHVVTNLSMSARQVTVTSDRVATGSSHRTGGYAIVDQDMENRWVVADARTLDLVDELIITHPPQAPVNEYATATTGTSRCLGSPRS